MLYFQRIDNHIETIRFYLKDKVDINGQTYRCLNRLLNDLYSELLDYEDITSSNQVYWYSSNIKKMCASLMMKIPLQHRYYGQAKIEIQKLLILMNNLSLQTFQTT